MSSTNPHTATVVWLADTGAVAVGIYDHDIPEHPTAMIASYPLNLSVVDG